jgi:3-oxoacyl-[acyl-carrier-protein] synthase II
MSVSGLKRVVITGVGAVTPIGSDVPSTFQGLLEKKNGIRLLKASDLENFDQLKVKSAGPLDTWDQVAWVKRVGLTSNILHALALSSQVEAIDDGDIYFNTIEDRARTGIMNGVGRSNVKDFSDNYSKVAKYGYSKFDRVGVLKYLPCIISAPVTIPFGFQGFSNIFMTGDSAGMNTIQSAYDTIRLGEADVMFAGNAEHGLEFGLLYSASTANFGLNLEADQSPETASRPFDKNRKGWVFSIGSGSLLLEELSHALARNAKIYAEVTGCTLISEAGENSTKEGSGFYRAMKIVQKHGEPDVVFSDASGSVQWDEAEAKAIYKLYGSNPLVTSIKGSLGHLGSSKVCINVALAAYAISKGIVPPIRNLEDPLNIPLNFVRDTKEVSINSAIINSSNFDGIAYGSVFLNKYLGN